MATRRKMNYQVKAEYLGKVKLEDGNGSTRLDETTPQDVLEKLFNSSVLGKGFIEQVVAEAATKPKDDAKAGQ